MLACNNSHFNPSGAVDSLSHILDLIDIKQKDNKPVISLKAHFSRVFLSLEMGGISIDLALQVGFMLCALLLRYQAVVQEFCLGRHSLTKANLQTLVEQCVNFNKGPWGDPVGKDGKVPRPSSSVNATRTSAGEDDNVYSALAGKSFNYHFNHWKKAITDDKGNITNPKLGGIKLK
jgi:hypothetical protein